MPAESRAKKAVTPRTPRGKKAEEDLKYRRQQAEVIAAEVEVEDKQVELASKKTQLKQTEAEHGQLLLLRWILGLVALLIIVWWQFRILDIVERQGAKDLDIPTPVLLALVTTTTVNVFGFLLIVYRFVFPLPPKPEPRPRKAKPKR